LSLYFSIESEGCSSSGGEDHKLSTIIFHQFSKLKLLLH